MLTDDEAREAERMRAEELASRPNSTVFDVKHDLVREPWPVSRLRAVVADITFRAAAMSADVDDETVRRQVIATGGPEVAEFQLTHGRMFHLITTSAVMKDSRSQDAIEAMMAVRERVESGAVSGRAADADASKAVLRALATPSE